MIQAPPMPRAEDAPRALMPAREESVPATRPRNARRPMLAPQWLQVVLIVGLLGAAVYVWLDGWHVWAGLLAVAGLAFGACFLLRRMVGDEYGRA
jgi:fatty acid desaturase